LQWSDPVRRPNFILLIKIKEKDHKRGIVIPIPLFLIGFTLVIMRIISYFFILNKGIDEKNHNRKSMLEEKTEVEQSSNKKSTKTGCFTVNTCSEKERKTAKLEFGLDESIKDFRKKGQEFRLTPQNIAYIQRGYRTLRWTGPFEFVNVSTSEESVKITFI
jgi:hypothetical protein